MTIIIWYTDRSIQGSDCLCSFCGQPILDTPIRMWRNDETEAHFHIDPCLDLFRISAEYAAILGLQTCRICGCTDEDGCPEGCWWVEEDLCSNCVTQS